jgi:predicted ATPase
MAQALNKLTIKGFKSIQSLEDFELTNLNILIGGNGAGKSNFIDFFRMLRAMMELPIPELSNASLDAYITDSGSCDDFLFKGPKATSQIEANILFGSNGYRFQLFPTADERFMISEEVKYYAGITGWWFLGSGHGNSELLKNKNRQVATGGASVGAYAYNGNATKDIPPSAVSAASVGLYVYDAISSWKIYHFHDTSKYAPVRRSETIYDNEYLRFDAANIAPFLLYLKERRNSSYRTIVDTIRLVAPFFDDFILKPGKNEKVRLMWKQKGSDYPLKPHQLSDGTLRFICLTTALLQPCQPSTIIIDEPELGLHPYAIAILAELIKSASQETQVIISTQSSALVDYFEPKDIIIVNRKKGASVFKRLNEKELSDWLEDYSMGDLWQKNIIDGSPVHE